MTSRAPASDLVALLAQHERETPERLATTFLGQDGAEASLDFAGLARRARAIGARLQSEGAAGERVLLLFDSGLDFLTAFLGCLHAGAAAVPLHPPRGRAADRYARVAADAAARFVLTSAAHASLAQAIGPHALDVGTVQDALAAEWRDPGVDGDTVAFLQYTSGSTAAPKGVVVRHANLLHNTRMMARAFRQDADSLFVSWLPLHHDMGLIGVALQALSLGAPCVLMAPERFLMEPYRWLEAIARFRAYTSGAPNFAYELCVRKVTDQQKATLDLSSWRHAFNGSEPVRGATLRRFAAAFGPCGFRPEAMYPCYGLAEATLFVAGGRQPDAPTVRRFDARALEEGRVVPLEDRPTPARELVSCGAAWCGQELAITDPESGAALSADRVGEVRLRGPSVAQGYWNAPEATARDFPGGWLRTGDLGFLFEGELYLCGRWKDLIILGGKNHHPEDLEETVEGAYSGIRRGCCAAFAIDEDGEERLVVVAELSPDALASPPEERRSAASAVTRAIASGHGIRTHAVTWLRPSALPKTTSGKLRRRAAREAWLAGTLFWRAA